MFGLLAGAWALYAGWIVVPDRYKPWVELDPAEPPNLFTSMKLARAQREPARCLALLSSAGIRFEPVADRVTGEGCALQNAVRLGGGRELLLHTPVLVSCRVALSFAMWERHVIQPAAATHLGTRIARIDHLGGYACRNVVTGRPQDNDVPGRRSQHATADALDVAAFSRADTGRAIVIRRDWMHEAAQPEVVLGPEAAFLRDAHKGACGLFDGVLGPDYNAVHADHFHLEAGGHWRMCH